MQWAKTANGRSLATPGTAGLCPVCGGDVISKCGEFVVWHWAHKTKDCDAWTEPESEWHRNWKARFPSQWQECTIGCHRADAVSPIGVIEFQRSFLSIHQIRERENFYGDLIWVVDASSWSLRREQKLCWPANANQCQQQEVFRWTRPRKNWINASRPLYLDIGAGSRHLFLLRQIDIKKQIMYAVTLRISKQDFLHMCYGLPRQLHPLLPAHSSFDFYNEAVNRRREIIAARINKELQPLNGLPLFALKEP